MIRHSVVALLAFALTGLTLVADEPKPDPDDPPKLTRKKKDEEKPAKKEENPAKKDLDPKEKIRPKEDEPADPDADPKAVLERINKNIRESEDRLRKKDAGDGTQQVQRDIVKDMDALIKRIKEQEQEQDPKDAKDAKDQKHNPQQQSRRPRRSQQRQQAQGEPKPDKQDGQGKQEQGKSGKDGGAGRENQQNPLNRNADIFKDIWGHLPETMRQEMDAYSREQFAAKYSEMLKQYYQTIAEKGRRTEKKP